MKRVCNRWLLSVYRHSPSVRGDEARGRRTTAATGRVVYYNTRVRRGSVAARRRTECNCIVYYDACAGVLPQYNNNNNTATTLLGDRRSSLATTEVSHALRLASHRSTFRAFPCTPACTYNRSRDASPPPPPRRPSPPITSSSL